MLLLDGYDFGFLRPRYTNDFPQFAHRFDEVVANLRKFLTLPQTMGVPLAVMSHAVDGLWHEFIVHTPQYTEFCATNYGEYLHHQPRSETYPVPVEAIRNFYLEYPRYYGKVPDIWFEDIPPAYVAAVALGQVPAAVQQLRWSGWPGWQN